MAVALGQTAVGAGSFGLLATGVGSLPLVVALFASIGLSVYGSTGVFYSCLGSVVGDSEVGAATAGGQTGINAGGLVVPPFRLVVETAGFGGGWALLAGSSSLAALLLFPVRRDVTGASR